MVETRARSAGHSSAPSTPVLLPQPASAVTDNSQQPQQQSCTMPTDAASAVASASADTATSASSRTPTATGTGRRSKRARPSSESEAKEREEKSSESIIDTASSPAVPTANPRRSSSKKRRQSRSKAAKRDVKDESKDESDDDDEERKKQADATAATAQTTSIPLPLLAPSSFRNEDLHCVVCLDFPNGEIQQCLNGHFLCKRCWTKVTDSEKTICPTCRVYLNRDKPIRARFAEQILAGLLVECPLSASGCTERIPFAQATQHSTSLCQYRAVQCKFYPLGCNWSGLALDQRKHFKSCAVKGWGPTEILKHVTQRAEEKEKIFKAERFKTKAYSNLCSYLSKRCRDIVFRDVHIETDSLTNERVANTFTACGLAWQLFLDPVRDVPAPTPHQTSASDSAAPAADSSPLSSAVSSIQQCFMHMKLISQIKRKTIVIILILPGPGLEMEFPPTITKVTYTRKAIESEPFKVHVMPDKIGEFYARDSINLRVGFVECSRGKMMSHFSTLRSASGRAHTDSVDDDDSDDSSSGEDSESLTGESSDLSDSDDSMGETYEYRPERSYHAHRHHHHRHDDMLDDYDDDFDDFDDDLDDEDLDDFSEDYQEAPEELYG